MMAVLQIKLSCHASLELYVLELPICVGLHGPHRHTRPQSSSSSEPQTQRWFRTLRSSDLPHVMEVARRIR